MPAIQLPVQAPALPAATTTLRIDLLGPPRITHAGRTPTLPRRQLRALLYRLGASAEPVPRDQLCFLFWPDVSEAVARRNLVVLLTHLRRALPVADAVVTSADGAGLNRRLVVSDTVLATDLAGATPAGQVPLDVLAAIAGLYRGPFLDGFTLPEREEFEAWVGRERQAWERRYLDALTALISGYSAAGDAAAAIDAARRYLAVDELAEAVHRQLIALYAWTGDRGAALRQFEQCAAVLERELGERPRPDTRAVYEAVRDGRGLLQVPATGASSKRAVQRGQPALRSPRVARPAARWDVPAPPTPLIGRADEIAAARALLSDRDVRLLTLSGVGGSGKTRLALGLAWDLRERFTDGAVFVPLAPLRDPALVIHAIARACGVGESGAARVGDLLSAYLHDKNLLLVLDNCEHLLPAAPAVAGLLAAAPRLRVLATSRVLLNLAGEHVLPVPPLPLPQLDRPTDPHEMAKQPAVALLLARARAVDPAFRLTAENAPDLAAICVRLDGLPLAIELAAARLKLLSPRALLDRLDHRLALLGGGPRDLPPRQQTLRATIDWSYQPLDAGEQVLFEQLGIFAGGFTVAAAEAVCGREEGGRSVLERLETLIDAHLLTRAMGEDGEPRFGMLETIREYALERLAARGATGDTARAHALYFRTLAEHAAAGARGPATGQWFRRLDGDHANLLAAIDAVLTVGDTESALRITAALGSYWLARGYLGEGRRLIERALALPQEERVAVASCKSDDESRARAHGSAADLAVPQGEFGIGQAHLQASARIWRALGRQRELSLALLNLGYISGLTGDLTTASAARAEGEALAQALDDPEALARVAQGKGRDARHTPDAAGAHRWLSIALAHARQHGDTLTLMHRLLDILPVTLAVGDAGAARAQAEEALAHARDLGHRVATAMALNDLGEVARHQGDDVAAAACYSESLQLRREMGNRSDVPRLLHNLAYLALHEGDLEGATSLFQESIDQFRERRISRGIAEGLAGLAGVMAVQGRPLRAARLWGAAEALREAEGCSMWPADRVEYARYLARARTAADDQAFASAWHEGRALAVEQALADVRDSAAPEAA